jgi:hypothetical protein
LQWKRNATAVDLISTQIGTSVTEETIGREEMIETRIAREGSEWIGMATEEMAMSGETIEREIIATKGATIEEEM